MYRSVISFFVLALLIGTVISINPQARREATDLWEEAKPTLVAWKDKAIEVLQDLISGGSRGHLAPEPVSPELNIDVIIAFNRDVSLPYQIS